jgi:putative PIG3 family NAD(P)H quinone oxidoreductase
MLAVVVTEPGPPDVLAVYEVEDPVATSGQVVIDVAATALNRADLLQRVARFDPPSDAPAWPGLECAGVITEIGEGVTDWSIGDRVCAILSGGGYAQRVAAPARQLLPVPDNVDLTEAAALPMAVCTAWDNMLTTGRLRSGEVVLIHGGSSGVGTMAIQLAREVGARIAVTAGSAAKLDFCAELGAEILINYRDDDFVSIVRARTDGHGADVILDNMAASYLSRNVDVLAATGRLVVIGFMGGTKAELDLEVLHRKRGSIIAATLRRRSADEKAAVVEDVHTNVWPMLEAGRIKPVVTARFTFAEASRAHQLLEDGGHGGKVLLIPPRP